MQHPMAPTSTDVYVHTWLKSRITSAAGRIPIPHNRTSPYFRTRTLVHFEAGPILAFVSVFYLFSTPLQLNSVRLSRVGLSQRTLVIKAAVEATEVHGLSCSEIGSLRTIRLNLPADLEMEFDQVSYHCLIPQIVCFAFVRAMSTAQVTPNS